MQNSALPKDTVDRDVRPFFRVSPCFRLWIVAVVSLVGAWLPGPVAEAQQLNWSIDVGAVGSAGTSSYDAATQSYQISGTGAGLGGTADAFHFAYYKAVCGDGSMVVHLASADANAQAALVLRASLGSGVISDAATFSTGAAQFVRRTAPGANSVASTAEAGAPTFSVPCWLKVVRAGDNVSAFVSADAMAWTALGSDTLAIGASSVYVGLAVSNGSASTVSTATANFDNLQSTFLPANGLQLWLKADAGVTQDTNGAVSVWADQSGNGNDAFQTTASQAPAAVPTVINGEPVVRFDGGSDYLQLPSGFSDFTQGLTALVVARPTSTASFQRFFDIGNGASADNLLLARNGGSNDLVYDTFLGGGFTTSVNAPGALALNTVQLFEVVHGTAAGTVTMYKNGLQVAQGSGSAINDVVRSSGFIGKSNWNDPLYQGDIAEVVLFDHALTDSERQAWETYLDAKYQYAAPPAMPSQLTLTALSPTRIAVSWTEPTQSVTGYTVERQNQDGSWSVIAILGGSAMSYVDTGLTAGRTYSYRVTASNAAGASPASAAVALSTPAANEGVASLPLGGLLLWLRADVGLIQNTSGAVSLWVDQSGNDNDAFQATASDAPVVVTSAIGNEPVIRFDGSNDYLQLPAGFSDFTQGLTALVVTRPTSTASWQRFFDIGNGAASDNLLLARNGGSSDLIYDAFEGGGDPTSVNAAGALALNTVQLLEVIHGTTGIATLYENGSAIGQGSAASINNVVRSSGFIGKSNWGDPLFQGDIAEVVLFSRALSEAERQAWESYLNSKYQIDAPPAAPTQVVVATLSSTRLALSWSESTTGVSGYVLERQNVDGSWAVVARPSGSVARYVDTGLTPGRSYNYRVSAAQGIAISAASPVGTGVTSVNADASDALPTNDVQLWLKADAGVTRDASGAVSLWSDQSGYGNDAFQGTASQAPVAVIAAINGQPVIRFDGNSSFLQLPSGFSDFTQGATALVVARPTAQASWQRFFELANGPGVDSMVFCRYSSSDQLAFQCVNGNGNLVANAATGGGVIALGTPQLFEFSQTGIGGTVTLYKNAQALTTQAAGQIANVTRTSNFIGKDNWGDPLFQGDIAEVVLFSRALSEAERQAWESYLNSKYQIDAPPAAPTQVVVATLSSTRLALTWADTDPSIISYAVERQNADGSWSVIATVSGTTTSYIDNNLTPGTTYDYQVIADSIAGSSPASAANPVTTLPAGGAPGFHVAGLQFWLEADAGVLQDANGGVSLWADQSGNNHDAIQDNPLNRPHLVPNSLNNEPVMHFDGSSTFFGFGSDLMAGLDSAEAFIVLRTTNAPNGSSDGLWNFGGYGDAYYPYANNYLYETFGAQHAYGPIVPPVPLNQYHLYNVSATNGAWAMRFNGNLATSSEINTPTFSADGAGYSLGLCRHGNLFPGDIAEVLVFNHALTDAERFALESYLNTKYAFIAAPAAPAGVSATAISATQASVLWMASAGASGYSVERKNLTAGGDFELVAAIAGGSVQAFLDTGLAAGSTYAYQVNAENVAGASVYSAPASLTMPLTGTAALPTENLLTWLRADIGVAQNDSQAVSAWTDLSGHGDNAAQDFAANQPQFVAAAINNAPVVRFDGGNAFLNFPHDLMNGVTAGEVLIVLRSTAPAGSPQGLWNFNDADNALYPSWDGGIYETFGTQNRYGPIFTTVPLDQCNLYEVSAAPGAWTMRLDGRVISASSSNTVAFSATNYSLGQSSSGYRFAGDVAEVLVFSQALDDGDRQAWEDYLNAKYQFNPLPATPTQVQVAALSNTQVEISWSEANHGVGSYMVERQNPDGTWSVIATVNGTVTSYVDNGLAPGASYQYRVTASNDLGASTTSAASAGATDPAVTGNDVLPVSGIRLWLQADTGVSLDASGRVATWADQSGGDRAASQWYGASRPQLVSNVANGRPAVHFDGTGTYLNLADHLMSGVTAGEVFVVTRAADPLTGSYRGMWLTSSRGGYGSGAFYPAADGTLYETFGTDTRYGPISSPTPLDQFNLYNVAAAPGAWTARLNGQVISSTQTNNPDFSATTFLLGVSGEGSPFAGDVAELLIFDHVLSDAERAAVQNYCTAKYALNGFLLGNANGDPDGDGLTNYQEFMAGSDPLDYYNGQTPLITIVSGNNQLGTPGTLVAQPLRVRVTSAAGAPLANAPVVFAITRSTGLVADPAAPTALSSSVTVRTGTDGTATVFFQAPVGTPAFTSLVTATAGYANRVNLVTFAEAIVATDDTSGDGLPDGWKLQHGLDLTTNDAAGDPDGDGLTNLQEYYLGTNPNVPDFTPDGVSVGWLVAHGMDPRYDSTSDLDPNGGGLTYLQEYQLEQSTVDLWKFDEGGQSVITTSTSGYKDFGLLAGNPTWIPDPDGGNALEFVQVGAQVDVETAADGHLDFAPQQSFSITARFQTSAAGSSRLVGKGAEAVSGAPGYALGMINGYLSASVGSGNTQLPGLGFQTNAAFNDGQWHHVAATFDQSTHLANLYVDGILQAVSLSNGSSGAVQGMSVDFSAASGLNATRPDAALIVGAADPAGTASFTGSMDNIGLFSKALTPAEVKALAGKQLNSPPVVAIDSPLPAAEFPELGSIPVRAEASSPTGTIAKVEFFSGSTKLGEADAFPYTITWIQVPLGAYAVTAKATDCRGASSTSAPVSIVVSADSDHDGLPDDWELQYFGNLDQSASASYLNDGISNLTKYLLGLDPTKPVATDAASISAVGLQVFTPLQ